MVSDRLIERWETVYREYVLAAEMVGNSEAGDRAVARLMARTSSDVATVWREIEADADLPWWLLAALAAAVQAFEFQAWDWTAWARQDGRAAGLRWRATSGPSAVSDGTA